MYIYIPPSLSTYICKAQECNLLNGPFGNGRTMAGWPQLTASGLWGPRATRGEASLIHVDPQTAALHSLPRDLADKWLVHLSQAPPLGGTTTLRPSSCGIEGYKKMEVH